MIKCFKGGRNREKMKGRRKTGKCSKKGGWVKCFKGEAKEKNESHIYTPLVWYSLSYQTSSQAQNVPTAFSEFRFTANDVGTLIDGSSARFQTQGSASLLQIQNDVTCSVRIIFFVREKTKYIWGCRWGKKSN